MPGRLYAAIYTVRLRTDKGDCFCRRSDRQQSVLPAGPPATASGAALHRAAMDVHAPVSEPASQTAGGLATAAAQAAAALPLQRPLSATPDDDPMSPAAAVSETAPGPSAAVHCPDASRGPDAAPAAAGARDQAMSNAPPADAGSAPASVTLQSSLVVETLRVGGSVVTSETEEVIVRGDLQAGDAAVTSAEGAAAGMDFTAAIVVAQDETDRHGHDCNPTLRCQQTLNAVQVILRYHQHHLAKLLEMTSSVPLSAVTPALVNRF